MSQGQATKFAWHNMDSNSMNAVFIAAFTSCNTAGRNGRTRWPFPSIYCFGNNDDSHAQGFWYTCMSYADVSWSHDPAAVCYHEKDSFQLRCMITIRPTDT